MTLPLRPEENWCMNSSQFISTYLAETKKICDTIDQEQILKTISGLSQLRRDGGRLFILGVGGSAGNASHAVNDFRKIAKIEAYAPTDNVSELTAWTNDVGWHSYFEEYLKTSKLGSKDALLVFSVGGGTENTSQLLVKGMQQAKEVGAKIYSIVSRDGGMAKKLSDACVLIPVLDNSRITPHAEGWQGVVWHLIVNGLCQET